MPSTQSSEFFVGAGMKKCRKILFDKGRKDGFLYWTLLIGLTFFLLIFISVELAFLAIDMSGQGKEWFSWVVWNRYTMGKKEKKYMLKSEDATYFAKISNPSIPNADKKRFHSLFANVHDPSLSTGK